MLNLQGLSTETDMVLITYIFLYAFLFQYRVALNTFTSSTLYFKYKLTINIKIFL